ncbi:MAG: hypothetical protein IJW88_07490 [Alistipes sp.]|nr:hypothetical protein [Alistipes sp.]
MKRLLLLIVLLTSVVLNVEAQEYRYAKRGYFRSVRIGVMNDQTTATSLDVGCSVDLVNGYAFNKWFMMGGGIGVQYTIYNIDSDDNSGQTNVKVPIYLHLRANVLDRKVTPYFSLNLGGGFCKGYLPDLGPDANRAEVNGSYEFYYVEPLAGVAVRFGGGKMLELGLSFYADFGRGMNGGPRLGVGFTW